MKMKMWLALLLGLTLALSVTPVLAQGEGNPDRVCFAGGSEVIRAGDAVRDVFALGCSVTVDQGATVSRDLVVIGGVADVAGQIGRDAFVIGGTMNLAPTAVVSRDAVTIGGHLNRAAGAQVGRDVVSNGSFNFGRAVTPVVVGPVSGWFPGYDWFGFQVLRDIITALALAALGVLLVVFFPQPVHRVMQAAQASPAPSLGVGCLTMLVLPALLVLLAITLIGIPVSIVLAFVAVAAVIFGWIALGYLAGNRILEALKVHSITPILAVVVGVLVLEVIRAVPCLGWLIAILVAGLGLGAVMLTYFGTRPYPLVPAWSLAGAMPPAAPLPPATTTPEPPAPSAPTPPAGTDSSGTSS